MGGGDQPRGRSRLAARTAALHHPRHLVDWPVALTVLVGAGLGAAPAASIGAAQALVLPSGVPARGRLGRLDGRRVGAPGCSPSAWWRHRCGTPGQPRGQLVADRRGRRARDGRSSMSAVTGLGVRCRLHRGMATGSDQGADRDSSPSCSGVRRPYAGRPDVGSGARPGDRPVRRSRPGARDRPGRRWPGAGSCDVLPWSSVRVVAERAVGVSDRGPRRPGVDRPTDVLVRRDVLDSPVVLADPPRRARVSDVVLLVEDGRAWVTGRRPQPRVAPCAACWADPGSRGWWSRCRSPQVHWSRRGRTRPSWLARRAGARAARRREWPRC